MEHEIRKFFEGITALNEHEQTELAIDHIVKTFRAVYLRVALDTILHDDKVIDVEDARLLAKAALRRSSEFNSETVLDAIRSGAS